VLRSVRCSTSHARRARALLAAALVVALAGAAVAQEPAKPSAVAKVEAPNMIVPLAITDKGKKLQECFDKMAAKVEAPQNTLAFIKGVPSIKAVGMDSQLAEQVCLAVRACDCACVLPA
jgi:hypothetical protein